MSETILSIENLRIHFETFAGEVQAIRGVNLKLQKGETLGAIAAIASVATLGALAAPASTPPRPCSNRTPPSVAAITQVDGAVG